MGLWEDAQDALEGDDARRREYEAEQRAQAASVKKEQSDAIAEFIAGMQRLSVAPKRFKSREAKWLSASVEGWVVCWEYLKGGTEYPLYVVGCDGNVYNLALKDPRRLDLSSRISEIFDYDGDVTTLEDMLKGALMRAMKK